MHEVITFLKVHLLVWLNAWNGHPSSPGPLFGGNTQSASTFWCSPLQPGHPFAQQTLPSPAPGTLLQRPAGGNSRLLKCQRSPAEGLLGWAPPVALGSVSLGSVCPSSENALQARLAGSFRGGRLLRCILGDSWSGGLPQQVSRKRGQVSAPKRVQLCLFMFQYLHFQGTLHWAAKNLHLKIRTSSVSEILSSSHQVTCLSLSQ